MRKLELKEVFDKVFKVGDKITTREWKEGYEEEIVLIGDVNFVTIYDGVYKTRTLDPYCFTHSKKLVKKDLEGFRTYYEITTVRRKECGSEKIHIERFICSARDENVCREDEDRIIFSEYLTEEEAIERGLKID